MKQALLTGLLILSGCTRLQRTSDECKPVAMQSTGQQCPDGYCIREQRDKPGIVVHYDCIPEKCNEGYCTKRLLWID